MHGLFVEAAQVILAKSILHRHKNFLHNSHRLDLWNDLLETRKESVSPQNEFKCQRILSSNDLKILQDYEARSVQLLGLHVRSSPLHRNTERPNCAADRRCRKNCILPGEGCRNVLCSSLCVFSGIVGWCKYKVVYLSLDNCFSHSSNSNAGGDRGSSHLPSDCNLRAHRLQHDWFRVDIREVLLVPLFDVLHLHVLHVLRHDGGGHDAQQ